MQITISGDIGSGKSTVGAFLASKLGAELIDCGQLYRQYAAKRDMSVLCLNKSRDNSIDKLIDNDLIRMGQENKPRVYISRTAWHFIPNAVHIYMSIDPGLAAERIFNRKTVAEEHDSLESIVKYNEERIAEEDARYERMYGVSRKQQLEEADLIFCVGNRNIDDVCQAVYRVVAGPFIANKLLCFDPRIAIPTQVLFDIDTSVVDMYVKGSNGDVLYVLADMQFVSGVPYICDGHHRIAAACLGGVKFVYTDKFSIVDEPLCELNNSDYYDWENYVKGDVHRVIKL